LDLSFDRLLMMMMTHISNLMEIRAVDSDVNRANSFIFYALCKTK